MQIEFLKFSRSFHYWCQRVVCANTHLLLIQRLVWSISISDMLRANLAMKIRNIDHIENIEELSSNDLKDLSTDYCKHVSTLFY